MTPAVDLLSFADAAPAVTNPAVGAPAVNLLLPVVATAPAVDLLLSVVVTAPAVDWLLSVVVTALLPDVVVVVVVVFVVISPAIDVCSLTDADKLTSLLVDIASDWASDSVCVGRGSEVGGFEPVIFIQISMVDGTEKQGLSIPVKTQLHAYMQIHCLTM